MMPPMWTMSLAAFAVAFTLLVTPVDADVIHLRNGNTIEAQGVVEEGDMVFYERLGGRIGVAKKDIPKIERVAKVPPQPGVIVVPPSAPRAGQKEAGTAERGSPKCQAMSAELRDIEAELAALRQKIAAQEAEVARYGKSLVKSLATTTLATMRQTEAMLEQRRLATKQRLAECTTANP